MNAQVILVEDELGNKNKRLKMRFAGKIVKHLGLQMYSGAVPAIAELIANAWDADANRVHITIPLDEKLKKSSKIVVKDNGCGMSYADVDSKYLVIGRDRRETEGGKSENLKRPVMAHKGIGKLAGFGIAQIVTVTTVRNGLRTAFTMNYEDIESLNQGETYFPGIIERDVETEEGNGTTIELDSIKLKRAINKDQFLRSMSRRFAVLSDQFQVLINGEILKKSGMELEFRFPNTGWETEKKGRHEIKWWMGFKEDPIQMEELRGISVIVRGKMAQEPFYFNMSGGVYGQHGMQYMTGEVVANFLDEDRDLVSSDRMSILWEDSLSAPLIEWGRLKVKQLLKKWVDLRRKKNFDKAIETHPDIAAAIEDYPPRERNELREALEKVSELPTVKPEKAKEIFDYVLSGFQSRSFMSMIRNVGDLPPDAQGEILTLLKEFDVLEAVKVSQLVHNRVRIIRKFREMIKDEVKETPDMHEYMAKYPWLINPAYMLLKHEKTLEKVIEEAFQSKMKGPGKKRRVDFLCVADSRLAVVVEIKRPGKTASRKEMIQIQDYVNYLRNHFEKTKDKESGHKQIIGYLIASDFDSDYEPMREMLYQGGINTRSWEGLLETTERLHRDFLDISIEKADINDPRIVAIIAERASFE